MPLKKKKKKKKKGYVAATSRNTSINKLVHISTYNFKNDRMLLPSLTAPYMNFSLTYASSF